MGTKLEDLPDEILSMVVENLVKSELPSWPFTPDNKANIADPQRTLEGLALTSTRMSRLCKPPLYTVNKDSPSPAHDVQPGSWIWSSGSLTSTTLPRSEVMLHLEACIGTVADAHAVAEVIRKNTKLQHIRVDLTRLALVTGDEAAFFNQLYCDDDVRDDDAQADAKSLRSFHLHIGKFYDAGWDSCLDFLGRAKVQDLTLIVAGGAYESLTVSDLAALEGLRRLYLSRGAIFWLIDDETAGRPGLADAVHISELWLPDCLAVGDIMAVHLLLAALPRQLCRLVLCCPRNEILDYLMTATDSDFLRSPLFGERSHYPSIHLIAETAGIEHVLGDDETMPDFFQVNPEIPALELQAKFAARNATITPANWYGEMKRQWLDAYEKSERYRTGSQVAAVAARR